MIAENKECLQKLKESLKASDVSDLTKELYTYHIENYLNWLGKTPLNQSNIKDIEAYLNQKNKEFVNRKFFGEKNKEITLNYKNLIKASLRKLYSANELEEVVKGIKGKKPEEKIPKTLSIDEISEVISASLSFYERKQDLHKNQQVYYLITLLYQSGARINELHKLLRADLDFSRNVVKLGSKRKEYLRKLNPAWALKFKEWLNAENRKKSVFLNDKGKALPKRTMQWLVENLCIKALGKPYSSHRFRASCITHRLENKEDFFLVSSNFHKSIETTKRYVGATARSLEKMINPMEKLK